MTKLGWIIGLSLLCGGLLTATMQAQGPNYPYSTALTWTLSASPNIASQNVYRAPLGTSCPASTPWTKLTTTALPATQTTYSDTAPPEGQYCYGVTATNKGGTESGLDIDAASVNIPPPPPTGLGATISKVNGQEDVTVAWANPKGTTANDLYAGTKSGGPYTLKHYHFASAIEKATEDNVPAATYYIVATATGKTGQSGISSQVKAVVP